MMGKIVIRVENVSKQYRLGKIGTGSIGHDINRWWHLVRGKDDPYIKVGETNDRRVKGSSQYVWALKELTFDIQEGEVVGIVGNNGAGKSTLLKLLSRTTLPSDGSIKIKGRVASLLEVGTGFHPELTGRENIFLNGSILGMSRAEIRRKFDQIVDFSGVERYIDTPVKRYSSGMYVRLAFAVAAHLDPEILIVDEVLAVGDAEFQKKAIGKMRDVSQSSGRTVLFVSHNIGAIRSLCSRGILLENGSMKFAGDINSTIECYVDNDQVMRNNQGIREWPESDAPGGPEVRLESIRLLNQRNMPSGQFSTASPIRVEINYVIKKDVVGSRINLQVLDANGTIAFASTNHGVDAGKKVKGRYTTTCIIPENLLNKGRYSVLIHMGIPGVRVLVKGEPFVSFHTIYMGGHGSTFTENWPGVVAPLLKWDTKIHNIDV